MCSWKKGGCTEESVNAIMCSWREGDSTEETENFVFFFLFYLVSLGTPMATARLVIPCKNKQVTEANTLMCVLKKAAEDSSLIDIYDGLRSVEVKSREKWREREKKETDRYIDRERVIARKRERERALTNWCWLRTVAPFAMQNLIDWVPYATWQRTQDTGHYPAALYPIEHYPASSTCPAPSPKQSRQLL